MPFQTSSAPQAGHTIRTGEESGRSLEGKLRQVCAAQEAKGPDKGCETVLHCRKWNPPLLLLHSRPSPRMEGFIGNSLLLQWLGLHAFIVKEPSSIPGQETTIPQAAKKICVYIYRI